MVPQTEVARRIGMPQQSFNRRMSGATPFSVDDIVAVARVTGLRLQWLLVGEGEPFGTQGCLIDLRLLPRLDSNQQPSGSRSALVLALPPDRTPRRRRLVADSARPLVTLHRTAAAA